MNIEDRLIVITGATGGIGRELCKLLDARKARLLMVSMDAAALDVLNAELGKRHLTLSVDLASSEGRSQLCRLAEQQGASGLVNLAGILDFNEYEAQSPAVIEKTLAVNLLSPMLLTRELLGQFKSRADAFIFNVGSVFGSIGHPGFVAYCSSKAGLKGFSEALARELADTRVKVFHIAPRATRTALNTDRINALNAALGNKSDTPGYVAARIVRQIRQETGLVVLGWPEKLFVLLNALVPGLVRSALVKNLPLIKQHARSEA